MDISVVLASTSPYRYQLLKRLQVEFATAVPPVDETPIAGEPPKTRAVRLACEKAQSLAGEYAGKGKVLIIGGDQTIADADAQIYDKPETKPNAIRQLLAMRGKTLFFWTAVAVYDTQNKTLTHRLVEHTARFRQADEAEITRYVEKESALNCAGGAQIEGLGIALMDSIDGGDPTALIGMPLIAVADLLRQAGLQIP